MAYIGQTLTEGTRRAYTFTATASQTTFNAVYGVGSVDVYQNGILLQPADYTATTGTTVVLGAGAAVNDEITIIAHNTFSVADTVSSSQGGTFAGNVSMSGTLGVTGAVTASNGLTVDDDGATPLIVDRATSSGTTIDVQKDGTSMATIGSSGSAGVIILNTNASSGVGLFGSTNNGGCLLPTNNTTAVDNAKDLGRSDVRWRNLYLSGGAYLGGTGASNKLDDYEEGTWTPTIHGGGSFSIQNATYTKIGKLVYAGFYANNTTGVTSTGQFFISLPFAVSPSNNYHGVGTVSYVGTANWAQYDISGPTPYSQQALMYFHKLSGSASALTNSEFQIMNGKPFIMGLVYHTDS
tara:strand:- start:189 stop:1244 length:1056 start_codon:yes stop_codon:yes gene_type:complete